MANRLKNMAIDMKMAITKSGTGSPAVDFAPKSAMNMTIQGTKPAMQPTMYEVQLVFSVTWLWSSIINPIKFMTAVKVNMESKVPTS